MSVLIVGADGNMGKRYAAVLNGMNEICHRVDKNNTKYEIKRMAEKCDSILIATPTETHLDLLKMLNPIGKPIMCEKPISKDIVKLESVLNEFEISGTPLNMVWQYKELIDPEKYGDTIYDCYQHGNDGLAWDCIQLISLAKGSITLRDKLWYLHCFLNGQRITRDAMEHAYLRHIKKWIKSPGNNLNDILDAHVKTEEYAKRERHARYN